MGCCYSGEEQAKVTSKPAPEPGQPLNVKLQKQGIFDEDYDVLDLSQGSKEQWMLLDTVGGLFSSKFKYYLKHRMLGQEESTVLGSCEIENSNKDFSYKITERKTSVDLDFDSDDDGDWSDDDMFDSDDDEVSIEVTQKFKSKWKLEKKCKLFMGDFGQPIGELKVKAKGKYKRKTKREVEIQEDEDGNRIPKYNIDVKHTTKLKAFHYKMDVFGSNMHLETKKNSAGGSFLRAGLEWTATNDNGAELFRVIGDGRNATVSTAPGAEPTSTLLAAFAVACKFDPEEVQGNADSACRGIPDPHGGHLGMEMGLSAATGFASMMA